MFTSKTFWGSSFTWGCILPASVIFLLIAGIPLSGLFKYVWVSSHTEQTGVTIYEDDDPRLSFPVSKKCETAMQAAAADPSENGEKLLVQTGDICLNKKEWEAALYQYPGAIGGSSAAYIDGTEYDLLCRLHPELKICVKP